MHQLKYITVALLPELVSQANSIDQAAVVIDTLRFTTTAAQAIQSGARSVRVAQQIDDARQLASSLSGSVRLCGERHCRPIEGFQFGNSPLEYNSDNVADCDLVFSTTNGTRAVEATREFAECLLAALVNRRAVAVAIQQSSIERWQIVCAGTDGQVAGEDLLAAGAIIDAMNDSTTFVLANDSARLALSLWRSVWCGDCCSLQGILEAYSGGRNLVETGYREDIEFACQVDSLTAIPARRKNEQNFRRL
jgi:2-phosphosulfolactate phosphatase